MPLDDLMHPDCRACQERKRLSVGMAVEIKQLKARLEKDLREEMERMLKAYLEAPDAA